MAHSFQFIKRGAPGGGPEREGMRTGIGALLKNIKIIFCFSFQIAIGTSAVSLITAILRHRNLHLANQPK
jgi:hypothetical protein